jgi:hypothetical protein
MEERAMPTWTASRILMVESAAVSGYLVFGMCPPVEGKRGAQIQQTVLVDERGNEILTWAETGNPVAQAC